MFSAPLTRGSTRALEWGLTQDFPSPSKLRICAVSYLNTVPLVWGMLHGDQRGLFDLELAVPSECADRLERGAADIGIVPAVEVHRLGLDIIRGAGIACREAVRSILLISKVPFEDIRLLAADTNSRTSVQLARILLERRHGARPRLLPHAPDLAAMLEAADAALIIGDPALRVDIARLPYYWSDLGAASTGPTKDLGRKMGTHIPLRRYSRQTSSAMILAFP